VSAARGALAQRRAGVLLHPTALPGPGGSLGPSARAFIDWLARAGFSVWQVLPLGPVGADRSPYRARSDMAGNPELIHWEEAPDPQGDHADFEAFCQRSAAWLNDYVLFEALAAEQSGAPWWQWPAPLRDRDAAALQQARARLAGDLRRRQIEQWVFERQWQSLRAYAHGKGVLLFGDLPIYVAPDSASTWTEREQFQLLPDGRPALQAGVPPDYFSADGQLWGNPLYDWRQARRDRFRFWRARMAMQIARFDLIRIDHFRGLEAYWAVPAGAPSARSGQWLSAPGAELLGALAKQHAQLPLIAEDLGVITPAVTALRESLGLPGMVVLQFGFDPRAPRSVHRFENHVADRVVYTGTHDHDTARGWYSGLSAGQRSFVDSSFARFDVVERQPWWSLIRLALRSPARVAMLQAQDVLGLGSEARMNNPGRTGSNWRWRMEAGALTPALARRLREATDEAGRLASGT
jgi:4-alpha-glucanotransferase